MSRGSLAASHACPMLAGTAPTSNTKSVCDQPSGSEGHMFTSSRSYSGSWVCALRDPARPALTGGLTWAHTPSVFIPSACWDQARFYSGLVGAPPIRASHCIDFLPLFASVCSISVCLYSLRAAAFSPFYSVVLAQHRRSVPPRRLRDLYRYRCTQALCPDYSFITCRWPAN